MSVCSHIMTENELSEKMKRVESLNTWTEKWRSMENETQDIGWYKTLCRFGVKPVWLRLCFSPRSVSSLQRGFFSPEVEMASFLAEIWKEQEILWLSSESWLYYWDATNKGWCRTGIPRPALGLLCEVPPSHCSIWEHIHLHIMPTINSSLFALSRRLLAKTGPPQTAVLYKSLKSRCTLFTSQAHDESASHTLAQHRTHMALIPTPSIITVQVALS